MTVTVSKPGAPSKIAAVNSVLPRDDSDPVGAFLASIVAQNRRAAYKVIQGHRDEGISGSAPTATPVRPAPTDRDRS